MTRLLRRARRLALPAALAAGCAAPATPPVFGPSVSAYQPPVHSGATWTVVRAPAGNAPPDAPVAAPEVAPASATEPQPGAALGAGAAPPGPIATPPGPAAPVPASVAPPRPAYAAPTEALPIDLPAVIRLVDANSPAIGLAQARLREARARLAQARVQWVPNLTAGAAYARFDGRTQNQRGEVFSVSRANLFLSGGPALTLDTSEAVFAPLVARRAVDAARLQAGATVLASELDAVLAYIDLVQAHAQLAINADTLDKAEAMLRAAINAREANLDRSPGDVNRAQAEVYNRRQERVDLEARAGVASARLGRLLLLPPTVRLVPVEAAILPVTLVDPAATLDGLVSTAIAYRPDLAADRVLVSAAWERVRRAERGPLYPKATLTNQTGSFGGGLNGDLSNFGSRNALNVQLYWELRNLGLGYRAEVAERSAQVDQAHFRVAEAQARAVAEVGEAAEVSAARAAAVPLAEGAVREAAELYRLHREGTFHAADAKNLFDALRPLQAIQLLNQARTQYLTAVLDYNRAQYRLFTALGRPPAQAVSQVNCPPVENQP